MAQVNTQQVTATTTAGALVAADASRTDLYITNEDLAIIVRVGDATVEKTGGTAANIGLAIMPGQTLSIVSAPMGGAQPAAAAWYVISDSGSPKVSVLEYGDFS